MRTTALPIFRLVITPRRVFSPEASAHLETAYDACLRGLGDAYSGDRYALSSAIGLLRSIARSVTPTIRIRKAA